jgi:hypothetical protein
MAKQPSGKPQTPCDLGLCNRQPGGKNRRKSVDAGLRVICRTTRPAFLRELASTQPFASLLRKRNNRLHPGRSRAQRSLTSESLPHASSRRKPGPRLDAGVIPESLGSGFRRNDKTGFTPSPPSHGRCTGEGKRFNGIARFLSRTPVHLT